MISQKTITTIYDRSHMFCEACGRKQGAEFHHVFFKSAYFGKDRDWSWNLAFVCRECHNAIHNNTDKGKIYNYELKKRAYHINRNRTKELALSVKRAGIKAKESYDRLK